MRLSTYLPPGSPGAGTSFDLDAHGRAAGVVTTAAGTFLVDLPRAAEARGSRLPARLLDLIAAGPPAWERARDLLGEAAADGAVAGRHLGDGEVSFPATGARLLAPLPAPPSLRDFSVFEEHVRAGAALRGEEIPAAWYEMPLYYKGNHRAVLGPGEPIPWPAFTRELDYELELAMVVGQRGRDLAPDEAVGHIFGYTVMNDVSARDVQRRELSARLGPAKSKDFATVLGPVLVTADELDPTGLRAVARIDGRAVTDTTTTGMRWSFPELLAHVSQGEDVFPGDVYGSGTVPGGCGLEHGRMLTPGAEVELEIEGIGILRNPVQAP